MQPGQISDDNNRSRSIANLRPGWQKGESGNPGGRPKMDPVVRALLDAHGPEAVRKIIALMDSDDERIVLMAAKEIVERAYGKIKEAKDDDGDKRSLTINIIRYTDGNQPPPQLDTQTVSVRTLALSGAGG